MIRKAVFFVCLTGWALAAGPPASGRAAKPSLQRVVIQSHPQGWGVAHKTVEADGSVRGGHLSGGPGQAMISESSARLSPKGFGRLKALVGRVYGRPVSETPEPDQKTVGYLTLVIVWRNGSSVTLHAKEGEKFPPEYQAIWDLVAKCKVGYW